jgi:uncharacterized protein YdeI (YjbR/CyaY-like superfamily)
VGGRTPPSDGWAVLPFDTDLAFDAWLDAHHGDQPGLWVRFAKKGSGIASVTFDEAQELAMCLGWADSKIRRYDYFFYLLRFQPRKRKSTWSAANKDPARLTAEGRMRTAGLSAMEAAKVSRRWDRS